MRLNREQLTIWLDRIIERFEILDRSVEKLNDGTDTDIGPLIGIMHSSTLDAVRSFNAEAPYGAIASLRHAFEAAMIAGKWLDDDDNASIFFSREGNLHQYLQSFTGAKLISSSLVCSGAIHAWMKHTDESLLPVTVPEYRALEDGSSELESLESSTLDACSLILRSQEDLLSAVVKRTGQSCSFQHKAIDFDSERKGGIL